MLLFRKKRGEAGVKLVYSFFYKLIILIVFVLLPAMALISLFGEDDSFEQNFIAKDMALIADSQQISSGNSVVFYKGKTNSFNFLFNESKIHVFKKIGH